MKVKFIDGIITLIAINLYVYYMLKWQETIKDRNNVSNLYSEILENEEYRVK